MLSFIIIIIIHSFENRLSTPSDISHPHLSRLNDPSLIFAKSGSLIEWLAQDRLSLWIECFFT